MVSVTQFIRVNKGIIDGVIKSWVPNARINDKERRTWVMNDEGLYNLARSQGVNI